MKDCNDSARASAYMRADRGTRSASRHSNAKTRRQSSIIRNELLRALFEERKIRDTRT
jgi:hypothetical protein